MQQSKVSVHLDWSEEDNAFLVTIPQLARNHNVCMPCSHGKTREEALQSAEEVIDMYLGKEESLPEQVKHAIQVLKNKL